MEYSASALFPTAVSYSCDWGDGSSPQTLSMIKLITYVLYDKISLKTLLELEDQNPKTEGDTIKYEIKHMFLNPGIYNLTCRYVLYSKNICFLNKK